MYASATYFFFLTSQTKFLRLSHMDHMVHSFPLMWVSPSPVLGHGECFQCFAIATGLLWTFLCILLEQMSQGFSGFYTQGGRASLYGIGIFNFITYRTVFSKVPSDPPLHSQLECVRIPLFYTYLGWSDLFIFAFLVVIKWCPGLNLQDEHFFHIIVH